MNKDIRKIDDNELENVTGGTGTAIDDAGRDGSDRERKNTGEDAGGGICLVYRYWFSFRHQCKIR